MAIYYLPPRRLLSSFYLYGFRFGFNSYLADLLKGHCTTVSIVSMAPWFNAPQSQTVSTYMSQHWCAAVTIISLLCEHLKDEQTETVIQGRQFTSLGAKRCRGWSLEGGNWSIMIQIHSHSIFHKKGVYILLPPTNTSTSLLFWQQQSVTLLLSFFQVLLDVLQRRSRSFFLIFFFLVSSLSMECS